MLLIACYRSCFPTAPFALPVIADWSVCLKPEAVGAARSHDIRNRRLARLQPTRTRSSDRMVP
jgi:hypothetical protein